MTARRCGSTSTGSAAPGVIWWPATAREHPTLMPRSERTRRNTATARPDLEHACTVAPPRHTAQCLA
ncbi:hypothetical protein [Rhodoferax fermentans]|uniref:hypothetical protein n=1 Tax=Rhodoferax fermentans TaxID=28066 RepID=UPI001301F69E|nr:hypothetical protein [Rhodoferax fermentans]